MYWTNSTVVTTPIAPVDTTQESNQNQYPQLSATEIKKVLTFSGMSDIGKLEAIIANTDTAGLLAMVGMSYADLKGILALPNDKLTTAPGINPAFPSTENTGVTSVHDASPILSGTGTPAEHPAAGSPTLAPPPPAPPNLAEMHDAGLPPKAIDSGADIDTVNTPSPATSDMVPDSNPALLAPAPEINEAQGMLPDDDCTVEFQPVLAEPVPVPENSDVQGMLPDGPCHVDLGKITQAPADPVDLSPESGSNGLFSVAAMRNVLDFFGMSDAGTAETLEAFTNIYDFFEWFDKLLIMKNAALSPADAGMNVPADDAVHTPAGAEADAQNNGGDLHNDTKQNQHDDDSPLVSSELLLTTLPGPGSRPLVEQPEPPPVLPPVVPPAVPPVVTTTEPVAPVTEPVAPVTEPVAPVTELVIPPSDPVTPVTQQPPGLNQGDNTQNIPSDTETAGGIKPGADPLVDAAVKVLSSSSSITGSAGVGLSGSALDIGSESTGVVLGVAAADVVRSISSGDFGFSFGGGSHHHDEHDSHHDTDGPDVTPLPPVTHIDPTPPDSNVNEVVNSPPALPLPPTGLPTHRLSSMPGFIMTRTARKPWPRLRTSRRRAMDHSMQTHCFLMMTYRPQCKTPVPDSHPPTSTPRTRTLLTRVPRSPSWTY